MIALALLATAAASAPLPPVVYQARTRDYDVRFRVAPELKAVPGGAYDALKAKVIADLKVFEAGAVTDMARVRRQMPTSPMATNPEVVRVEVDFVTATPHLAGFIRRDYVDAHGAHPGSDLSGLLFDRQSGVRLSAPDLLRPRTDMAPLDARLVAAIRTAKTLRGMPSSLTDGFVKPGQLTWAGGVDLSATHDLITASVSKDGGDARSAAPVLATLTAPGRAGGLQFLYSPYDIGAYAEGPYRIVLAQPVFAADLKARYRADFAGRPAGDLAPNPLAGFPADVPPFKP